MYVPIYVNGYFTEGIVGNLFREWMENPSNSERVLWSAIFESNRTEKTAEEKGRRWVCKWACEEIVSSLLQEHEEDLLLSFRMKGDRKGPGNESKESCNRDADLGGYIRWLLFFRENVKRLV